MHLSLSNFSIYFLDADNLLSSPSGLNFATDEKLYELLDDMRDWEKNLPDDLKYRGPKTPRSGGLCCQIVSFSLTIVSDGFIDKQVSCICCMPRYR